MTDDSLAERASLRRRVEGLLSEGLWLEASRVAASGADRHPADADMQRIASGCLFRMANYERARLYAARAAALQPESAEFAQHYGVTLNACRDHKPAISQLTRSARLAPRNAETYSQLAFAAAELGDVRCAAELALFAARMDPLSEGRRLSAAHHLSRAARWDDAAAILRGGLARGLRSALMLRTLSGLLSQRGRYEEALREVDEALLLEPENADCHLDRSWLLSQMQRGEAACGAVRRALEIDPENRAARRHAINLYVENGEIEEALRQGGMLLAAEPNDPEYLSCMAHLLEIKSMRGAAAGMADIAALKGERHARGLPPPLRFADRLVGQVRSISALVLRDIRGRYGDSRLGFFWALMEPLVHVGFLAVVFEFTMHGKPPLGDNFFFFYFTGVMPYLLMSHLTTGVGAVVRGNKNLLQIAQVTPFDLMAAKAIVDIFTSLLIYLLFSAMFAVDGLDVAPASAPLVAAAFCMTAVLGFGTGMICSSVFEFGPAGETVVNVVLRVLYFASGIFYVPGAMPIFARDILSYNPFLHIIDTMRMGYFANYEPPWVVPGYAASFALLTLLLGMVAVTAMSSRMRAIH